MIHRHVNLRRASPASLRDWCLHTAGEDGRGICIGFETRVRSGGAAGITLPSALGSLVVCFGVVSHQSDAFCRGFLDFVQLEAFLGELGEELLICYVSMIFDRTNRDADVAFLMRRKRA